MTSPLLSNSSLWVCPANSAISAALSDDLDLDLYNLEEEEEELFGWIRLNPPPSVLLLIESAELIELPDFERPRLSFEYRSFSLLRLF